MKLPSSLSAAKSSARTRLSASASPFTTASNHSRSSLFNSASAVGGLMTLPWPAALFLVCVKIGCAAARRSSAIDKIRFKKCLLFSPGVKQAQVFFRLGRRDFRHFQILLDVGDVAHPDKRDVDTRGRARELNRALRVRA